MRVKKLQLVFKDILDRAGAFLLLVALFPVLCLIGIVIKAADGGYVFFHQQRLGRSARAFKIWKFRTMIVNADRFLDENGVATRERVTRVGRFLRRFSLDELPQLINILKGDMSLVGPRPVLPEHYDRYTDEQRGRFAMKPGVTGLAQINGRNELPWSKRIEFDLEYIRRFSLLLDMKIIFRTVIMLLSGGVQSLDRNPEKVDDLGAPR